MKEKLKKAVGSFVTRCFVCVCLFGAATVLKRMNVPLFEKVMRLLCGDTDLKAAKAILISLAKELWPM